MGYQFHTIKQGNPELPVVLFLHGFMGDSGDFDRVIERLSPHFCCLAIDLPGHGKTRVEGDESLYTMPHTAHAIVNWLDQQHYSHCFLVGYSMGGRLALYLALHFPQRFPKVVLESASPGLTTEAERTERLHHDRALAEQLEADFVSFLSYWYSQPLFHTLRQHPAFEQVKERRSRNRPSELAQSLRYLSTGLQPSLWELLAQHRQPLLLLVGAHDDKFRAINQAMVAHCPTAQLQTVANCGHTIHLENTDAFSNYVYTFLQ